MIFFPPKINPRMIQQMMKHPLIKNGHYRSERSWLKTRASLLEETFPTGYPFEEKPLTRQRE